MGELIRLAERREARKARGGRGREPVRAEFLFDLGCPHTYLAVERVERTFDHVTWTPASATALRCSSMSEDELTRVRALAEARATELRLPLEWPDHFPSEVPAAMRVATFAAEQGRGAAFVLAACRLAFCGGFDLDDPEILAEAAAAAGLGLDDCLLAARDVRRDGAVEGAARRLLAAGADRLPALRVGRALYWGEDRVAEAALSARLGAAVRV
jgi:2-hydroxychromene-2-carboxylate isomerase